MTNKETEIKFSILAIILIILLCFAITPITLQNDTFYTIKIGEYITHNGITMLDPFSWHEGLKYTYPHWGYDLMMYFIYNLSGQTGIYVSTIILSSMLGIALYLANSKLTKNKLTSFIITIGAMYCLKDFITARAQLVTFILFALTIYFIEQFLDTKKKRYAFRINYYTNLNSKYTFSSIPILLYIVFTIYRRILVINII